MTNFTLRIDDNELVEQFDNLAKLHGVSRTAYIIRLMRDAVTADYVPMREGEGYRAITDSGGEATLIRHSKYVSGGTSELDQEQAVAFEQAKRLASPENGSRWLEARQVLETAGFTVYRLAV